MLDADGGTRIGPALQEFLDTPRYADRARGALTIVLSDGLERGDPAPMAHAVQRLAKLSYRLHWWTPLATDPTYRPITRAMAAIQDDLDDLAGARDLPTLLRTGETTLKTTSTRTTTSGPPKGSRGSTAR